MRKRLVKSRTNRMLTGTIAGIGEYIGIDPSILRVIYAIIVLCGFGTPVILYIVLAIIIPEGQSGNHSQPYNKRQSRPQDNQPYYENHPDKQRRKKAEKVDEEDWSDF